MKTSEIQKICRELYFYYDTINEANSEGSEISVNRYSWMYSPLLKEKLIAAPVLALPEGPDGHIIYCDASGIGTDAVLI